jgi:DNA-binding NarL/FixJ family response regulator
VDKQPSGTKRANRESIQTPGRRKNVLLVSHPGILQHILRETFTNRSDLDTVEVANGCLSAIEMIRQKQPDLVVIDSNLPEAETRALILWMKNEQQHIRSLALAETTQQLKKSSSMGADMVLKSSTLLDNLDQVLINLASQSTKEITEKKSNK